MRRRKRHDYDGEPATTAAPGDAAPAAAASASARATEAEGDDRADRRPGGEVVGGLKRATIEQGKKVAIVVGADVADHVHLHG